MKNWTVFLVVSLVTLVLVILVLQLYSSEKRPPVPVKVATGEWPPYVGSDLPGHGRLARLVAQTLAQIDYEPRFRFGSWEKAQNDAAAGEVLGAFPFIEREQLARSDALATFHYVLFYKRAPFRDDGRDPASIDSLEELRSYRVGMVEGYRLWSWLADEVQVAQRYKTLRLAFEALEREKIDLLGEGRIAGEYHLHRPDVPLDATHFDVLGDSESWLPSSEQELYLIAEDSPRGHAFIARFNAALEVVKAGPFHADPAEPSGLEGADRVTLASAPVAARDPDDGQWYLLPRGTRAAVLEWDSAYHQGRAEPPKDGGGTPGRCRIKILNGPQRGRVLLVAADEVVLIPRETP